MVMDDGVGNNGEGGCNSGGDGVIGLDNGCDDDERVMVLMEVMDVIVMVIRLKGMMGMPKFT